jgi:hypothetical protein
MFTPIATGCGPFFDPPIANRVNINRYGRPNPFDDRESPAPGGGYGGPVRPPQASFGQGPSPYGGQRNNNNNYGGMDE